MENNEGGATTGPWRRPAAAETKTGVIEWWVIAASGHCPSYLDCRTRDFHDYAGLRHWP